MVRITVYDDAVKAWNQERASKDLQSLKPGFFKEIASYVRRLKEAHRNLDQKTLKAIVIQDELSRLEKLVSQLVDVRLEKMWRASQTQSQVQPDNVEKQAHEAFNDVARSYDRLKEDLSQGREPQSFQASKKERLTIRFLKDVPSIVGVDLRTYGPFLKEDVAVVPYENAESLIRQGAAAEISTTVR